MKMPSRYAWCWFTAALACAGEPPRFAVGEVEFTRPAGSGEPNLTTTRSGAALTWLEPSPDGGHALRLATRTDGRWSEARTIVAGRPFFVNWADFPSLAELEGGTWLVHWLERAGEGTYAYHVKLALSTDRGASWSEPITPHRDASLTEHGFVSVEAWRDGAQLVWLDGRQMNPEADALDHGDMSLRGTTVSAAGVLGEDRLLDARTCECCQTALARTASGLVAAYRDRSPEEIRDVAVVRYVDGAWSEPARVAPDEFHYPGCPVNGPQLAAAGDTVVVAWYTAPQGSPRVQVAFSTDGGASFGTPIRVDGGDPLGRVDVELLEAGAALVVWLERTPEAAELRGRRVTRAGRADPAFRIAETAESRGSGFPRMTRVGNEVVVAWTLVGEQGGVRVRAVRLVE